MLGVKLNVENIFNLKIKSLGRLIMRHLLLLSSFSFSMLLSGCASITQGTSQVITFSFDPPEARCVATRGSDGVLGTITQSMPTLSVSKGASDIVLACSAPGYKPSSLRMVSKTQASGVVGGFFLDLGIVDMMTGAMWAYENQVNVALEPDESSRRPR